jgi:dTDP-4-dehydrorhamnose reductase
LVGRSVVAYCAAQGEEALGFDHGALDITDPSGVQKVFDGAHPDVVINCAAWTDVDGCELDRVRAHDVNARGPELLALGCRRVGALLITISTDYVFDGQKDGFYTQRDHPEPKSVYGVSKLQGERLAQAAWPRTIVVRTGFVFGVGGKNFLSTVVERARRGERLVAINDAFGTPTYARDLARRLTCLARLDLPGVYHVVNSGPGVSYEEFARAALSEAGCPSQIESVSADLLKRPAPRPRNARLRCLLSEAIGLEPMPFWEDALREFVEECLKTLQIEVS